MNARIGFLLASAFSLLLLAALSWNMAPSAQAQASSTPTPATLEPTKAASASATVTATAAATLTGDALLAQRIDAYITKKVDREDISGSVLIARDGVPLLNKGYGLADSSWDIPNSPTTKFGVGHLTTMFTAAAILQLQEQGLLDVQDSICDYLDPCPNAWQPVTIHQLLTHTSGLPNYIFLPDFDQIKCGPTTPAQFLKRMVELPLDFAPGDHIAYSNTNYILLGQIVATVSDMPFGRYLRLNILDPLGMLDTGLDLRGLVLSQRATGYINKTQEVDYTDPSQLSSALGMYSTTEDLLRWDQALYGDELLPQEVLAPMFTAQDGTFFEPDGYATYGLFLEPMGGHQALNTTGWSYGFNGEFDRFLDEKLTVIILSNRDNESAHDLAGAIANLIFAGK